MIPQCRYPQRFMVSPCGFHDGFYDADSAPDGWSDCSELSDTEAAQLMVRRMMNADKERK